MTKYWLILAMLSGVGCAGTVDDAGTARGAIQDKSLTEAAAKEGTGSPAADPGDKEKGCGVDTPSKPSTGDPCTQELQGLLDKLKAATEPEQAQQLIAEFEALSSKCATSGAPVDPKAPPIDPKAPPIDPKQDPCEQSVAAAGAYLDEAKKIGDPEQLAGAIEKYDATLAACPPVVSGASDPCLAAAQGYLDAAEKTGDPEQIALAKEKYAATWTACTAPANDAPPPEKK